MEYKQFTAARADTGAVLPLALVTVFLTGTATKASLFDNVGAGIANPFTTSVVGLAGYAVANGIYDISITSADTLYTIPKMVGVQSYDLSGVAPTASPTFTGTVNAATTVITSASAGAFAAGPNGATNPTFKVDASTASAATGVQVKGAAAGAGAAISVLSSGADEALTFNAKGAGTIGIGSVSTGRVTITPVTTITGSLTLSSALIYGGVTLTNAVTGTGAMALAISPTFTGTITAAIANFSGAVGFAAAVTATTIGCTTLTASGGLLTTSATAGFGYATGAGGVQTQATNKSTALTLNKPVGQLTLNGAALAASTSVSFTFTNSAIIAVTDMVYIQIGSVGSAASYIVQVDNVAVGSCRVHLRNISAGSLSEALVLNFAVIRGVIA